MPGKSSDLEESDDEIFNSEMEEIITEEASQSDECPVKTGSSACPEQNDEIYSSYESDEVSEDELLPPISTENIIEGPRLRSRK